MNIRKSINEIFQILGIETSAINTEEEDWIEQLSRTVRIIHRRLIIRIHPDKGGDTQQAQEINAALDDFFWYVEKMPNELRKYFTVTPEIDFGALLRDVTDNKTMKQSKKTADSSPTSESGTKRGSQTDSQPASESGTRHGSQTITDEELLADGMTMDLIRNDRRLALAITGNNQDDIPEFMRSRLQIPDDSIARNITHEYIKYIREFGLRKPQTYREWLEEEKKIMQLILEKRQNIFTILGNRWYFNTAGGLMTDKVSQALRKEYFKEQLELIRTNKPMPTLIEWLQHKLNEIEKSQGHESR
ncbi:MAG: hypothetical protein FWC53_02315 [Firmicutes bacterium]|nr:hypothetical protein [Bacillota bacterium]